MRTLPRARMIVGASVVLGSGVVVRHPFLAATVRAPAAGTTAPGHYASVDGLKMYYEDRGTGQALVLLHGGLSGAIDFVHLWPLLSRSRRVIVVELQGHGHTADIQRPLRYESMADDIAALIQQLDLRQADILGYSVGGEVALQTAIRHPGLVRTLVLISTAYQRRGWYPATLAQEEASLTAKGAKAMLPTPFYQYYAKVAPRPADWPTLVARVGQLLKRDYDWSRAVAALTTPTLVVVGDSDRVRPDHAVALVRLLGGAKMDGGASGTPTAQGTPLPTAQLAVLPGTTHFTILSRTDLLLPILTPFLDAARPATTGT
jgi:pimeloyl-ACP methyl ester carboxylesterase